MAAEALDALAAYLASMAPILSRSFPASRPTRRAGEPCSASSRGKRRETCPLRGLVTWPDASVGRFGAAFREINRWGTIEHRRLGGDAVHGTLLKRAAIAGITAEGGERLSSHGLRAGFVSEAYMAGARDEQGTASRVILIGTAMLTPRIECRAQRITSVPINESIERQPI